MSFPALPDFRGLTAVVVGDYVLDEYLYGQTERISREAPVPIVTHERTELKLGGAGNVAHNLAALGVRVRAVGWVGRDAAGEALRQRSKQVGIDVRRLRPSSAVTTTVKTRILAGALHTTHQQLLRLDREGSIPASQRRALVASVEDALAGADGLIVSDYGNGCVGPELIRRCSAWARQLPVCVDSRFNLGAFHGVTLLKPNVSELGAWEGRRGEGRGMAQLSDVLRAGRKLLERGRLRGALVTRGRDGMLLLERGARPLVLSAAGSPEAVDVTGAGDTVLATFGAAFMATGQMAPAARLANLAAGLVVQKPGTATVTVRELEALLGR